MLVVSVILKDSKYIQNNSCCAVCQSIYHWAKQCPDRHQEENDNIKSL